MTPNDLPVARANSRFQFSLYSLFVLTTVAAVASAIWVNWSLIGGVLLFLLCLVVAIALIAAVRVAIHLAIAQGEQRADP